MGQAGANENPPPSKLVASVFARQLSTRLLRQRSASTRPHPNLPPRAGEGAITSASAHDRPALLLPPRLRTRTCSRTERTRRACRPSRLCTHRTQQRFRHFHLRERRGTVACTAVARTDLRTAEAAADRRVARPRPKDRITPMLAALAGHARFGDLWVEHPDSDLAKPLAGLARSFGNALRPALRKAGLMTDKENTQAAAPARGVRRTATTRSWQWPIRATARRWPLGIPRLKLLSDAPSRSALKLDEALLTLLTPEERELLLKPGMTAADLGAAPGGWTWILTRNHLRVTSVDNGPLRQNVMDTGLVEHLRADGFQWKPSQPLGLDGLRHGGTAAPRGRAHGHLVPRRLVQAQRLQPQVADEEALGRNPAVPGPVRRTDARGRYESAPSSCTTTAKRSPSSLPRRNSHGTMPWTPSGPARRSHALTRCRHLLSAMARPPSSATSCRRRSRSATSVMT